MRKSSPLDALFPRTRQAVLATVFRDPAREWYLSDLARQIGVTPSSLQREVVSLARAGILRRRDDGNRAYYSAETEGPLFGDLQGLLLRTAGLRDVLAERLEPFRDRIAVAFVYGSFARKEEQPGSDIDLMVIGRVGLAELALTLKDAEEKLLRPVNPSVYTPEEMAGKLVTGHHFLETVISQEKLFVLGDKDDLAAATERKPRPDAPNEQAGARRPPDGRRARPKRRGNPRSLGRPLFRHGLQRRPSNGEDGRRVRWIPRRRPGSPLDEL